MQLSVIIPTYNRKNVLIKCLNALFNQTYPQSNYEIIVIDDGSTDGTEKMIKTMIDGAPCALRYFKQENKGPAAARNVGIRNANGKIVLFVGDDIIVTPSLLEEHLKWHGQYPDNNVAVLGYVTWSPEIEITPFMKWLENGGPQFHFWQIKDKIEVDAHNYFYTCNLSLKRKFILENGLFDTEFSYAAFEDIELGYRLKNKGLKMKYNKDAVGYHYHYTSLASACERMKRVRESSIIYHSKISGIDKKNSPRKSSLAKELIIKILYPIAGFILKIIAVIFEKKKILPKVYSFVLESSSKKGMEIADD